MAAGYLRQATVCQSCEHRDCAQTRSMAAAMCRLCDHPIGWDVGFFTDPMDPKRLALVHADCLYWEVERDQAAVGI